MNKKQLLIGMVTFLPGMSGARKLNVFSTQSRKASNATSGRYGYSVWMRHLVLAAESGLNADPRTVAELGPGASLGMGLAAVLSGVDRYYAFDVVAHANVERNLRALDELIELFQQRAEIPGESEFPRAKPQLRSWAFPSHILTDARLQRTLVPERIARIRRSLADTRTADSMIVYHVPWADAAAVQPGTVDMVFSQAVLEHIDDLPTAYKAMYAWLRPGGVMSHQIDYKAHRTSRQWNGHWAMSDLTWRLVRGRRQYLLNRQPHSTHLRLIEGAGFKVCRQLPFYTEPAVPRERLARQYRQLSDDDLRTSGAFVQAVKLNY